MAAFPVYYDPPVKYGDANKAPLGHERAQWRCSIDVVHLEGDIEQVPEADREAWLNSAKVLSKYHAEDNLLMYGGVSALWQQLIGSGAITAFNNANAYIGVGDSTTAEAATQTDLQASTNKLRKAMDSGYPSHTDGTTSGAASIVFRCTLGGSDANWGTGVQEVAVFNAATGGRMLNRRVTNLGTKTAGNTAQVTITITIS